MYLPRKLLFTSIIFAR